MDNNINGYVEYCKLFSVLIKNKNSMYLQLEGNIQTIILDEEIGTDLEKFDFFSEWLGRSKNTICSFS